jgi:hypothetical protein
MPGRSPQVGRPALAWGSLHSTRVFGSGVALDSESHLGAGARRRTPSNRLSPAHSHRHQCARRGAVRVRGHTARVVGALTPKRGRDGSVTHFCALGTTLRRQLIANAIGCVCRRRVEKEDCGNGQCLEEGSHEGEPEVYPAHGYLQEIPAFRTPGGVKPGVKDVGWWERREYSWCPVSPPRRSWGERGLPLIYSTSEDGFCT